MTNYLDMSLIEINKLLIEKKIKPIDLVEEALDKIKSNNNYNIFITLNEEGARSKAKELENVEIDNILFGIPIAIKDNICTKNLRTTAASHMLDDFVPVYDATIVELINRKNMIIIGKTNMDEFACGSTGESSYFGKVINPFNNTITCGGSSSGSAASISAGITPLSIGTDTGGSVRHPASFNNLVGMKPTYGRISRYGVISYSSSLDTVGVFSRNVYENALLLNTIAKKDSRDLTSISTEEDFTSLINEDIKGMRIAVPKEYIDNGNLDENIKKSVEKLIHFLKEKGASIEYINIDLLDYTIALYHIITFVEISSSLARYDGIKYGYKPKYDNDENLYTKTREVFGEEIKRRIMLGTFILSDKAKKDSYEKALEIKKDMENNFKKLFEKYDLIIGPITNFLPKREDEPKDDLKGFLDDIYVTPSNICGLPSLSLPIDMHEDRPISVQIIGWQKNESKVYKLGNYIEKNYDGGKNV